MRDYVVSSNIIVMKFQTILFHACHATGANKSEGGCRRILFPFLKTPNMSFQKRKMFESQLCKETVQMEFRFQKVVSALIDTLKARRITPCDLMCKLVAVQTPQELRTVDKPKLFRECYNAIMNSKNMAFAFSTISKYYSFFNYGIVEHIICEFGIDKACLNEYKKELEEFCKRRVSECPFNSFGMEATGDSRLVFVLDSNFATYTVKSLIELQCELCKILRVAPHELRVVAVSDECVKVAFAFPSRLVEITFPLSSDQQKLLLSQDVENVLCNDKVVFARYVQGFLEGSKRYSLLKPLPKIGE